MKLWLDAQLPPALAAWITLTFGIDAQSVRDLWRPKTTSLAVGDQRGRPCQI